MRKEKYSIKNIKTIELGKQHEKGILTILFTDVSETLESADEVVRLAFSHKDIKNSPLYIPLIKTDEGYELPVDEIFTDLPGSYISTIYGYKLIEDGTISERALSDQFIMHTSPAQDVTKSNKAEHIPKVLKDIYTSFSDLIKEIKEKLANGEFKGDKGPQGEQGPPGEQGNPGQRGPQGIPGVVLPTNGMYSLFINDSGYLTMAYNEADVPPSLYIDDNGCLIFGEE